MASDITFTDSDEGKNVVNQSGETIGRVVEVKGGSAHVDPDPSVTDAIMSKLGWGSREGGTYELDTDAVATVTDDEIRLASL